MKRQLISVKNCDMHCLELIDTVVNQGEIIDRQNRFISKLINENLEKENTINVLASDKFD